MNVLYSKNLPCIRIYTAGKENDYEAFFVVRTGFDHVIVLQFSRKLMRVHSLF